MSKKAKVSRVVYADYPVEEILPFTGPAAPQMLIQFNGYEVHVHMDSLRYQVFRESLECCECGIVGTVMRLEVDRSGHIAVPHRAHFNLYAVTADGLVLMTRDHILPACFGGPEKLRNMRTMCSNCNGARGNEPPS
jgi:5-methylcytosine-specific restriction endonuclease McrA